MQLFDVGELLLKDKNGVYYEIGSLKNVSLDIAVDGMVASTQFQSPIKFSGGANLINGIAESAQFNGDILGSIIFGSSATPAEGHYPDSQIWVPGNGFTLTPTLTAGFTIGENIGAFYCDTGEPLAKIATNLHPSPGEYTFNGTKYTFSTTETRSVRVRFLAESSSVGTTYDISNTYQGILPTFEVWLSNTTNGKKVFLRLYACVSSKFNLGLALENWTTSRFEFSAQSNNSLELGLLSIL